MKAKKPRKVVSEQNFKIYTVGYIHKHLHFPATGAFLLGLAPQSVSVAV